ncbi:MAG: epoxyqueuosine reductase [Deltaproteobacteria bacterium]|nr:epoxyqueuosine reductase [Deltaproteobacteria bacterium]
MHRDPSAENARWIEKVITDFIQTSPRNTLKNENDDKAWETPLVGFSRGDDPLYEAFKEHVGPFHLTPLELFAATFKDSGIQAEELTIISWILPHNTATKIDNQKEDCYPAERWARARIFGEEVNVALRKQVVASLESEGYRAVAPALTPQFSMQISEKYGRASTWSERHAAYASGLGTFGLCAGLITPVGKAMRTGSVIAHIPVPPTVRPYTDHHEYCLFFTKGICGKCISRCPAKAITGSGKDKELCLNHLFPVTSDYVMSHYAFEGYGCGLCQTGVPCESNIPKKNDVK